MSMKPDTLTLLIGPSSLQLILGFIPPDLRSFALFTCSFWYHTIRYTIPPSPSRYPSSTPSLASPLSSLLSLLPPSLLLPSPTFLPLSLSPSLPLPSPLSFYLLTLLFSSLLFSRALRHYKRVDIKEQGKIAARYGYISMKKRRERGREKGREREGRGRGRERRGRWERRERGETEERERERRDGGVKH